MAAKNGYFQLRFNGKKAYVHIFPPEEGGERVEINEVIRYLDTKRFTHYNIKELNHAITAEDGETDVLLGDWDGIEINEMMDIQVSSDKMQVVCRFYPPSPKGQYMDAQEMINDLVFEKIKYGMDQNAMFAFLSNREYCRDYILAKGKAPVEGHNARIEYKFNTDVNLSPKHNEDGTVDYKELNTISSVQEGDLIAKLIKEDVGQPGINVYGEEMKPHTVKTTRLEYGNNISISEDGTEAYSNVTGHAQLVNGKIFVSDVYEVPADVDNSIGNIDYLGSVHVKGNVKGGFIVKANGDIIVEGIVEDAILVAQGQIIVKSGIHGMNKGTMKAGKSVIVKFVENAAVISGGYVETETIMHSKVDAASYIKVTGKKGLINGGRVCAGRYIEADNIGSEMGTVTIIEAGTKPEQKERYGQLRKLIKEQTEDIAKSKTILLTYGEKMAKGEHLPADRLLFVQKLSLDYKERKKQLDLYREEFEGLHQEMLLENNAYVRVNKQIFSGAVINISDLSYNVTKDNAYCKYVREEGEIVCRPL